MKNSNADTTDKAAKAAAAKALWEKDKKEFKKWALSLAGAKPVRNKEKVDGILEFVESDKKKRKIIIQVKGDEQLVPRMLKDLLDTIDKEGAVIGLIISLQNPRLGMITDSVHAGNYESELWKRKFLKVQMRTVMELQEGKSFDIPQTARLPKKSSHGRDKTESARLI